MTWVVLAGVLCAVWTGYVYNRLVGLVNRSSNAWADIDVQLKRRHDLVSNLVEVVRGYAAHEGQVLERVVAARTVAERAREDASPREAGDTESTLASEVRSLIAVVEAYPDLKASERFLDLHTALTDIENDLQQARRYYNAVVRDYNTRIEVIPDVLVARGLAFRHREFFSLADSAEAVAPRVELPR